MILGDAINRSLEAFILYNKIETNLEGVRLQGNTGIIETSIIGCDIRNTDSAHYNLYFSGGNNSSINIKEVTRNNLSGRS